MTNAQALELLELSPDQAGNVHQLQKAHARRKASVQEQFDSATNAQARATLLQKLQAVDVALVLLKADSNRPRPEVPTTTATPANGAARAAAGPAAPQRPEDWIAATPWSAIANEGPGEFRSPDEHDSAHRPTREQPARPAQPAARKPSRPAHVAPAAAQAPAVPVARPAPSKPPTARPATPAAPADRSHDQDRAPARPARAPEHAQATRPRPQERPQAQTPRARQQAPATPPTARSHSQPPARQRPAETAPERPPPPAESRPPTQRPATIGRIRAPITVALPESIFDGPPRVAPDVAAMAGAPNPAPDRPQAQPPARVRLPRPIEPTRARIELDDELPVIRRPQRANRRRSLVPLVLLVLVIAGTAGAAGWAWREGALDSLLSRGPSMAARDSAGIQKPRPQPREPIAIQPPTPLENGATDAGQSTAAAPVEDAATLEASAAQAEEIQRLSGQLSQLAQTLGGPPGIDAEAQLAAADRARAAGDVDESAELLARLQDGLRAQVSAAEEAIRARQRLSNAGAMPRSAPLSAVAAAHVQELADQAAAEIASGDYESAGEDFEQALDARLRLSREAEELETRRARAAAQELRAREALETLDVRPAGALAEAMADAQVVRGEGPLVAGWLRGDRAAADLAAEYERLGTVLEMSADRLERVAGLRGQMEADARQVAEIEAEFEDLPPGSKQLDAWLDGGLALPDSKARQGADALAAGDLAEAVEAYETAAAQAAERLEVAVTVRNQVARHAEAVTGVRETSVSAEAGLREMQDRALAWAQTAEPPETGDAWRDLAARIGQDLEHLQALSAAAQGALPADPDLLAETVDRAQLQAQAFIALAPAAQALATAEQRLLLLRDVAATAEQASAVVDQPVSAAAGAREALAELAGEKADIDDTAVAAARGAFDEATRQVIAVGESLAAPAADALAAALAERQERYRQEFGGVDLRQVWQPEGSSASPADLAEPVAAALAAGADADALRRELQVGDVETAESILEHVRSLDRASTTLKSLRDAAEQPDEQGLRRLHHSAAAGDRGEVAALLALAVTPAPRDEQGRTPVGLALSAGHLDVARLLLDAGARPQGWIEEGRPIVFVAAASPGALRLLLEHGAPARDLHRGETALHALAWQANREQAPAERQLESARILLDAGIDRTVRNRSGATAAELATSLGLRELADFLRTAPDKQQRP